MSGTCFECKFMRNRTDLEPCEHCTNDFAMTGIHPSFMPRRTLTNADKIRSMTVEEMASFFDLHVPGYWRRDAWLKWLEQEG